MSKRNTILSTGNRYHAVNRGVATQRLFVTDEDYARAMELLFYYRRSRPGVKYSVFLRLNKGSKFKVLKEISNDKDLLVEIEAFCLMPNHIHLLLKQIKENGISIFMSTFQNSFARYFNRKNKRKGPMFEGRFKSVRITSEEQFVHVARYIMLNPLSAGVVKNMEDLKRYPYSCLREYLDKSSDLKICSREFILNHFKSADKLSSFVSDNANYQHKLQQIKRDILEFKHTS